MNTSTNTTAWNGTGSVEDPYIVDGADKLKLLADQVNNGTDHAGKHFMCTADIDLSNELWTPIGNDGNCFNGVFHGCGRTMRGLHIENMEGTTCFGLFGHIGGQGRLEHLFIDDSLGVYISDCMEINAGSLAGINRGVITACVAARCTVSCTATALFDDAACYAGGLVGRNSGSICHCGSENDVKAQAISIEASYAYAGGLVGRHGVEGQMLGCFATGNITCIGDSLLAGGITGENKGEFGYCAWSINAPQFVGNNASSVRDRVDNEKIALGDDAESCLSGAHDARYGDRQKTTAAGDERLSTREMAGVLNVGAEKAGYFWCANFSEGKAFMRVYPPLQGEGSEADPHRIASELDLDIFAASASQGNTYCGKTIALTNDISFSTSDNPYNYWIPVGLHEAAPFDGTFDGKGYIIKNLILPCPSEKKSNIGFFGVIGQGGTVKNCSFVHTDMPYSLTVCDYDVNIGIVAGQNKGIIVGCGVTCGSGHPAKA